LQLVETCELFKCSLKSAEISIGDGSKGLAGDSEIVGHHGGR